MPFINCVNDINLYKEGEILVKFYNKYKHGLVILAYSIVYILLFAYLEQRPVHGYHIVHTVFDDWIPFCEYFIIPYLLWFPYMFLAVLYFIFINKNKHEYYQLIFNLMMGMTVFLIVSYVYPNAQHLRPVEFPRDNLFTDAADQLRGSEKSQRNPAWLPYADHIDHSFHNVPEAAFRDRRMYGRNPCFIRFPFILPAEGIRNRKCLLP